jgi:thiamine kinase-like enzyme
MSQADKSLENLIKYVVDNWDYFGVKIKKTTLMPKVLMRQGSVSGIVYRGIGLFAAESKEPVFYVKVIPNKFRERFEREYKSLKSLSEMALSKNLQETIPVRSLLSKSDKLTYLISKYIHARPLDNYLSKEPEIEMAIEYGKMSLKWLRGFQREKREMKKFSLSGSRRELDQLTKYFQRLPAAVEPAFSEIIDGLKPYVGRKVPYGLSHGDFAPDNIMFKDKQLVQIIDWEEFSLHRLPIMDLLKFAVVITLGLAPTLQKDRQRAERYFDWLEKERQLFLQEHDLDGGFFDSYSKIALIEITNSLLRKGKVEKMKGERLLKLKLHHIAIFYPDKSYFACLKRSILGEN